MLRSEERIESLKLEKKKKDILHRFSVEDIFSVGSFLDEDDTNNLMRKGFEKALRNEVGRFNFSKEMEREEGGGAIVSKEERVALVKNFIEQTSADELILFVWDGMAFGLIFKPSDFGVIEKVLWSSDGDIVLLSKDAKQGICFLEEEHFTRFSVWGLSKVVST